MPMKNLFDQTIRNELITRIQTLDEHRQPQWGRMTVSQMLRHCMLWEEMALGKQLYKQSFLGRLFGKIALKDMLRDEPMKPNLPTVPGFKITGDGDAAAEKTKLIDLIEEHACCSSAGFLHPFFGELSSQQGSLIAYKHLDHHLRQFGV
jgi:hypothetical protein